MDISLWKAKNVRSITNPSQNRLQFLERKMNFSQTVDEIELLFEIFTNIPNNDKIKRKSRNKSKEAAFAERLIRKTRDLLKKPVFQSGDACWIEVLPTITKEYNITVHSTKK